MRVILMDRVEGLGEPGEVVEVANGYARNYLIPRGLAERATRESMARWEEEKKKRERIAEMAREEAEKKAAQLEDAEVQISARAGESGKLFGSVTAAQIADALKDETGVELDRRKIVLEEPLRELGEYRIRVALHEGVNVFVAVVVTGEEE
ncbi:MAG: 50S ribosomal protein L9 [Bacillota bacterium]